MGAGCSGGDSTNVYSTESTIKDKEQERRERRRRLEEHQNIVFREDEFQQRQLAMWKERGLKDIVSLCAMYPMPVVMCLEGGEIAYVNPHVYAASGHSVQTLSEGNHLSKLLQLEGDSIDSLEWCRRTPMTLKAANGDMIPANVVSIPLEIEARTGFEAALDDDLEFEDKHDRKRMLSTAQKVADDPLVVISFIEPVLPRTVDEQALHISLRSSENDNDHPLAGVLAPDAPGCITAGRDEDIAELVDSDHGSQPHSEEHTSEPEDAAEPAPAAADAEAADDVPITTRAVRPPTPPLRNARATPPPSPRSSPDTAPTQSPYAASRKSSFRNKSVTHSDVAQKVVVVDPNASAEKHAPGADDEHTSSGEHTAPAGDNGVDGSGDFGRFQEAMPPLPVAARNLRGVRGRASIGSSSVGSPQLRRMSLRSNGSAPGHPNLFSPTSSEVSIPHSSQPMKPLDLNLVHGGRRRTNPRDGYRESLCGMSSVASVVSPHTAPLSSCVTTPHTQQLRVTDPMDEALMLGDVSLIIHPDTGVISWASHAAVHLFGHFDTDSVVGKPVRNFLDPCDRGADGELDTLTRLARGPPINCDWRKAPIKVGILYDSDASDTTDTFHVQLSSLAQLAPDKCLVRLGNNVPRRKSVMGFLRETGIPDELGAIVESLADSTVVVGKDGTILCCNRSFEKLFECPLSMMAEQDISIFVPDAFQSRHREMVRRHARSSRTHKKFMRKHRAMVGQTMASRQVIPLDITIAEYLYSKETLFYICTCRRMVDLPILQRFNETAAELMVQVGCSVPENFVLTQSDKLLAQYTAAPMPESPATDVHDALIAAAPREAAAEETPNGALDQPAAAAG